MTWVGWAVVVHVACAAVFVAVWWREVGRHDAAERRNRELHAGYRGHPGWFDAPAPDPVDDAEFRAIFDRAYPQQAPARSESEGAA